MPKPNKGHFPAVTRVIIQGNVFLDNVPATRCKPDEQVALVFVNLDNTEYQLRMTGFKNKGANTAVTEANLFVGVSASHQIKPMDATTVQRTVRPAANWGTGAGQFPYTTYEFTMQLFNKNGTGAPLDELDPDYDITP
jgi:hypothetical protein